MLGYDRDNANRLVSLAEKIAGARAAKHPAVRRYANGELNQVQMEAMLKQDGIGDAFFPIALARGKLETKAGRQKKCVAAIRKRFLLGEINEAQLRVFLRGQRLDGEQVDELAEGMVCERDARGLRASGSTLCQWFEEGIIGTASFFNRLRNLGWDTDDASRFVQHCTIRLVRKQTAAEKKKLEDAIRRTKQAEAERRRIARELERLRNEEETEIRQETTRQKRRRKLLNDTAAIMAKTTVIPLTESKRASNEVFQSINRNALATRDEILELMLEASEAPETVDFGSLELTTLFLINDRLFPSPIPDAIPSPA